MSKNDNFPKRLRATREGRQWKQADLARRADLQPSAISQFETGQREPSPENLRKLASALGVTTDFLFSGIESTSVAGKQLQAVVRYAQSMSGTDLDMLEDFAALLAKKAKARSNEKESD